MRYSVTYGRKVRTKAYETLEISMTADFDTADTQPEEAFAYLRDLVNMWIQEERERILEKEVKRD